MVPHDATRRMIELIPSGKILDIGVGEGRDALYLAGKGYDVTGVDISDIAVKRFLEVAERNNLKVRSFAGNIETFQFDDYDAILAYYTLLFLNKPNFFEIVRMMKTHTKKGGINIIEQFIKDYDVETKFPALLDSGELKELYKDWEILEYRQGKTKMKMKKEDGSSIFHNMVLMVARKP